jgi:hypothetical protein
MIEKTPLCPQRVRKIAGSFAFIEHRFLRDGFLEGLTHHELVLYLLLVLVADRNGLSYYSYEKICTLLRLCLDEYIEARNALIKKELIAFDGYLYQVLSLPQSPPGQRASPLTTPQEMAERDPATIRHIVRDSLGGTYD